MERGRAKWLSEKQEIEKVKVDIGNIVKLDVRGTVFKTSKASMLIEQDSGLAAMFSGRHSFGEVIPGASDELVFFIDRNPEVFKLLLDWLACLQSNQEQQFKRVLQLLPQLDLVKLEIEAQFSR
jgi:hypothetical protein